MDLQIEKPILDIKDLEQTPQADGKFKFIPLSDYKDGMEKEIHEYVDPKGNKGYQIFIQKTDRNGRYLMSKGYGVQAKERTFDWRLIEE